MRKFCKVLFLFVLPIFIIGIVLEISLRNIPNCYSKKSVYLEKNSNSIETLILGNSHSYYGLNPQYIDGKTYNAAFVSQTLDIDYQFLKHYENSLDSLEFVILRLSYFSLFEQLGKTDEDWRISYYNIFTEINLDNTLKHQLHMMSVKLKTNLSLVSDFYLKDIDKVYCDNLGFGNISSFMGNMTMTLDEAGLAAAKKHTIDDHSLMDENVSTLERIIEFCQKKDIKVILFTPPAYKGYYQNLEEKQLALTIKTGQRMQQIYSNVKYFNLLKSDEFATADFFDGDHLNEQGAKKLSLLMDSILKSNGNN
ncbi:hypothetical protein M0G43_13010 [Subsaxibacter sp. CAU 1640]|uniref:hypothetical protein n=1 Tax=Subsaxibacter sp. CAU 1640 TaxID=2933271 RepID=UPI0020033BB0|nr:hypothetical protein [Subsaxibacter sp. CAU 1640]MCK7591499.1 hypothetical protein [Subsaxibacter sp. CAU 1640]